MWYLRFFYEKISKFIIFLDILCQNLSFYKNATITKHFYNFYCYFSFIAPVEGFATVAQWCNPPLLILRSNV